MSLFSRIFKQRPPHLRSVGIDETPDMPPIDRDTPIDQQFADTREALATERAESRRLRGELALVNGHLESVGVDELRPTHGLSDDGISFAVSRRWLERIGQPTLDGIMKLQAEAAGTYLRFVDDGKLVNFEVDLDFMRLELMEKSSNAGILAIIGVQFLDQLTKGSDVEALMKEYAQLKSIKQEHLTLALSRTGVIRNFSISTIEGEDAAYHICVKISLDSKAWRTFIETPVVFIGKLITEAKIARNDMKAGQRTRAHRSATSTRGEESAAAAS